jgi:hypothetical protein
MTTTPPEEPMTSEHTTSRRPFDGGGLYFKQVAAACFITGLYLHLTRLFFGLDAVTDRILSPTVDGFFGVAMAYAAIAGWLSWRGVEHPNRVHKIIFGAILVYLSVSVPIHIRSFFFDNTTDVLGLLPPWYSVFFMGLVSSILVFVWRLRINRPHRRRAGPAVPEGVRPRVGAR